MCLLASSFSWAQQVTLDFGTNGWGLPENSSNKLVAPNTYTNGTYEIVLTGSEGAGYYFNTMGNYLMLGKKGASLQLPAFDFAVSKIEIEGNNKASAKVLQNIYVGNTAVSAQTTGATTTNTYEIAPAYQAAGNIYTLKVLSNHNTQIKSIKIYKNDGKASAELAWSTGTATAYINGKANTFPTLANPHNLAVTYSSSAENVATIGADGVVTPKAVGTTVIKAETAETETYSAGSASYTLEVKDARVPLVRFLKYLNVKVDVGATLDNPAALISVYGDTIQGVTLTYSSADNTIATVDSKGTVTGVKAGEVNITASFAGNDQYEAVSRYYKLTVGEGGGAASGVPNIAAYAALPNNTVESIAGDVTAYYVSGNSLYVKDATGYLCIYGQQEIAYKNGDVIPGGFGGTKVTYNGGPEMKAPLTGFKTPTSNTPVAPDQATSSDVTPANWGHYVVLKNVTIATAGANKTYNVTDANGTIQAYNNFNVSIPADLTATYDVTGIVSTYKNNPQLLFTDITLAGGGTIAIPEVNDFAGVYSQPKGTNAKVVKPITAIYQNGSNLWVKDEQGAYGLVYGALSNRFANGDQITGGVMSWTEYNNMKELVPVDTTFTKSGSVAPVEPEETALEEISQDMAHYYLLVKNATLTQEANDTTGHTYIINDGTMDMILYNKFYQTLTMPTDLSGQFDVKCFVTLYQKKNTQTTVIELYPVEVKSLAAPLLGDVNEDGIVNVTDVTALINTILGNAHWTRVDINADGIVNVTDVTALINIILNEKP